MSLHINTAGGNPGGAKTVHIELDPLPPEPPYLETARRLDGMGFWIIVLAAPGEPLAGGKAATGKEPIPGVKGWGLVRWKIKGIELGIRKAGRGLGMCLGPGRGPGGAWLGDVEGDGPE